MRLARFLYRLARITNTVTTKKPARRVKNILVGRTLGRMTRSLFK